MSQDFWEVLSGIEIILLTLYLKSVFNHGVINGAQHDGNI